MVIDIVYLDYNRRPYGKQLLRENIDNMGWPIRRLVTIRQHGIAKAVNAGLAATQGSDAVVLLSNDIRMPQGWLREMVATAQLIERTGIVGIHTVERLPDLMLVQGVYVRPCPCPFGNNLITRPLIEAIGGYNEVYDPYGHQDSDYAYRAAKAGFLNYYLPHLKADHVGHDVGDGSEYRRMKDEGLARSMGMHQAVLAGYDESGHYYVPIIEEEQYYGEDRQT